MNKQFRLSTLLLIVLLYAVACALAAMFHLPLIQQVLALAVVTVFVAVDFFLIGLRKRASPGIARASILCSYYSTAFAIASIVCLARYTSTPIPASAPGPAPTLQAAFEPAIRAAAIFFLYLIAFVLFSSIGFVASLFTVRRIWAARVLFLLNLPAAGLLAWFCVANAYCWLAGCE